MNSNADPDWFDFYRKFVDKAVHDVGAKRQGVDINLSRKLVAGSPKQAQVTIQVLWGEHAPMVKRGDERHLDISLHCCSLMLAYVLEFGLEHPSTQMIFQFCLGLEEEFNKYLESQAATIKAAKREPPQATSAEAVPSGIDKHAVLGEFDTLTSDLEEEINARLGEYAGIRAAVVLEDELYLGPRGHIFVIPVSEWTLFHRIVERLASSRRIVDIDANAIDRAGADSRFTAANDEGHILVIDGRHGITDGCIEAITRLFGRIEHTASSFNDEFGIVFATSAAVFASIEPNRRRALLRNCHYRGYYARDLHTESSVTDIVPGPFPFGP